MVIFFSWKAINPLKHIILNKPQVVKLLLQCSGKWGQIFSSLLAMTNVKHNGLLIHKNILRWKNKPGHRRQRNPLPAQCMMCWGESQNKKLWFWLKWNPPKSMVVRGQHLLWVHVSGNKSGPWSQLGCVLNFMFYYIYVYWKYIFIEHPPYGRLHMWGWGWASKDNGVSCP